MLNIDYLFIKPSKGEPLIETDTLKVDMQGIRNSVSTLPYRQILILPTQTLSSFGIKAGELRENMIVSGKDIHNLPSGTIIQVGEVKIRLTYHCEPCNRIKEIAKLKEIEHKRGYLGSFLSSGTIRKHDKILISDEIMEEIPYKIKDRIRWFLDKQDDIVSIKKLAQGVSLSQGFYRAIPNMLKNMEEKYRDLVDYPSKKKTS